MEKKVSASTVFFVALLTPIVLMYLWGGYLLTKIANLNDRLKNLEKG